MQRVDERTGMRRYDSSVISGHIPPVSRPRKQLQLTLRRREALTGIAFAALPVAGFTVFYVIPFCITIYRTLYTPTGGHFVGMSHYNSVLRSEAFRLAAGNTFRFIGIGVPLLLALSLAFALMLNTRIKGKDGFRTAFILPMILPTASVILVFQIFFDSGGVINYILAKIGIDTVAFLYSGNAFWVLIFLYIWKNAGYVIVLTMAGLIQIPKELYENASIDGAGGLRQFRKITLPMMGPTLFFVTIISISGAFKSFREAFALAGSYPHESIYMLQHFMNNNFAKLNYPRLSVAAVLTFIIVFLFVLVMFIWHEKRGRIYE